MKEYYFDLEQIIKCLYLILCVYTVFFSFGIKKCEVDKARKLLKKVTVSIRERYGENHPLIGSIFFSVGSIHLYQKDLHHALNAFQQAETIHSTSLGSDNPMVIMSLTKIAMIKLALNEIEQALICFQQVVRIYRKTLGYSHPKVAIILNNIGVCHYHEVGGLIASLKSFEEALETQRESMLQCKNSKKKNELYAAMACTLENIAFIHYKKKEYTESIMALEEALSLRQKVFGGDDRLCETNENLAYVMAVANSKGNICDLEHMTNMYIEMLGN
jgi:tetratricopeptide (TPR) repeat protein